MHRTRTNVSPVLAAALLAISTLSACQTTANHDDSETPAQVASRARLTQLSQWLTGSFSSAKQAAEDTSYFDIRLHIVPCWTDRADGPWLYVEQARADLLNQPYRQRVYHLSKINDQTFKSEVLEIDGDPLRYAGAWKSPTPLADISPSELKLKDGCEVILTWTPEQQAFIGGTQGKGCSSTLRGAAHAVSEVTLTENALLSWDRGYDASDQQVWGAVKGGYRFDRLDQ